MRLRLIGDALGVFLASEGRIIRVIGEPGMGAGDFIEVVLPEAPLKAAMIRYGLNVLGLSVIISMITAALVYFALNGLLVQPMMRITRNMLRFSQNPEDASRIIVPSPRRDEIGTAERELAHMQDELTQTLHQKSRLAALGLAVSKINHDLRNMLANAQLISDRLSSLPDPAVQRFAPKLIASLGRAINLAESTLKFGRAEEAAAPSRADAPASAGGGGRRRAGAAARRRHRLDHRDGRGAARRCRSRPAVPRLEQSRAAMPCRPSSSRSREHGRPHQVAGRAMASASPSRSATTDRACRRRRAPTCSRPSRARRARAAPASGSPWRRSW